MPSDRFACADGGAWLTALLADRASDGPPVSTESLALAAGCAHTHLLNVVAGRRKVTSALASKLVVAAGIELEEADYLALITKPVPGKPDERAAWRAAVQEAQKRRLDRLDRVPPIAMESWRRDAEIWLPMLDPETDPLTLRPPLPRRCLDGVPRSAPRRLVWVGREPQAMMLARLPWMVHNLRTAELQTRTIVGAIPARLAPALGALLAERVRALAEAVPETGGPRLLFQCGAWMFPVSERVGSARSAPPAEHAADWRPATRESDPPIRPPVLVYDRGRVWLRALTHAVRASDPEKKSLSWQAKRLQIAEPTLYAIVDQRRPFLPTLLDRVAVRYALSADEVEDVRLLIALEERGGPRPELLEELAIRRLARGIIDPSREGFIAFTRWPWMTVLELAATPAFRPDPVWIAGVLRPSVSAAEAEEILRGLLALGFLKVDDMGVPRPNQALIRSPDNLSERQIGRSLWRGSELARMALERPEEIPCAEGCYVSVPTDFVPELLEAMHKLSKEFLKEMASITGGIDSDQAFCLFLHAAPISRNLGENSTP